MFGWLNKKEVIDKEYMAPVSPEPKAELVLSEPVISLIASLKRIDEWTYHIKGYADSVSTRYAYRWVDTHTFTNIAHGLIVVFKTDYCGYDSCTLEWTTMDEKKALCECFKEVVNLQILRGQQIRAQELAGMRQAFMVLVKEEDNG